MLATQVRHHRRVDLGRDLLRPRPDLPKVGRGQEVDVEWELAARVVRHPAGTVAAHVRAARGVVVPAAAAALEQVARKLNFLVDGLGLHDLVEVLHADVAAGTHGAGRVVGPDVAVDAPAFAAPFFLQGFVEREAAHQDDLAARLAQARDAGLGEPGLRVGVVFLQDLGELGVGAVAGAFAFEGEEEGFAGVGVEEVENVGVEVFEVLCAGEADGEDGVDQDQLVRVGLVGRGDLDAQVEEAHAVLELFFRTDCLTSYRGRGVVVRWTVMRAWDGEGAQRGLVWHFRHPAGQVGGGIESYVVAARQEDACEADSGVGGEACQGFRLGGGYWTVHLVLAAGFGGEGQAKAFMGVVDDGFDVCMDGREGRDFHTALAG